MSNITHANKCILREPCEKADTPACNSLCPSFIAIHGHDGAGGRVSAANVPADYGHLTLSTSPARAEQTRAYGMLDDYAATFKRMFETDSDRIKSLYLWSQSPGTGKTTSAAALINEWIIVHYIGSIKRGLRPTDRPALFFDVNEFQTLFNTFNRPRVPDHIAEPAAERYYSVHKNAMSAPFVVLDDIGVRDCTDAFRGDLHTIINERTANGMPTVFTSNVPLSELSRIYDARLADRVRDQCAEIHFGGESRRGMRK